MAFEIVAIRTEGYLPDTPDKITEVKLSDGTIETVPQVVSYIDDKMEYYYTTSSLTKASVTSVHPSSGHAYIRTVGNGTRRDNLLSLPEF